MCGWLDKTPVDTIRCAHAPERNACLFQPPYRVLLHRPESVLQGGQRVFAGRPVLELHTELVGQVSIIRQLRLNCRRCRRLCRLGLCFPSIPACVAAVNPEVVLP